MEFFSTRDVARKRVDLRTALFEGLAPDGGLYQPAEEPDLRALIRSFGSETAFVDVSAAMIQALFPAEYDARSARDLAMRAFPFAPALKPLRGHRQQLLELFHGPSCAFKDFGASFLATLMDDLLSGSGERAVILTATSGDTGSAVAHAFHGNANIDVVILYPSGRVSPLQEQQLTTLGGNVHALEVDGSFDDCQRMVKEAFANRDLRGAVPLSSANSINVGRLIPQSFYYLWTFAQLKDTVNDEFIFCVPSGNFGNLTAGLLAWRWGMPVADFVAATNANDVVPEYLRTGDYRARPSVHTLANAMDVGDPSNFERMRALFAGGALDITSVVRGWSISDAEIASTMSDVYEVDGELVCPHTAAGIAAGSRAIEAGTGTEATIVTLATAHPAKFVEVVEEAVGVRPEIPERLARLMNLPKKATRVAAEGAALATFLRDHFT